MAIWGVSCGLVKTTANGKMISKVLAENRKESKLYDNILEHINEMQPEDRDALRDAFRDWEGDLVDSVDNNKHLALALYSLTHSENFKNWFKDSKAVDENGEPILLYHGAPKEFNTFKGRSFFTAQKTVAQTYANTKAYEAYNKSEGEVSFTPTVLPVFLNVKNPKVFGNLITYRDIDSEVQNNVDNDGIIANKVQDVNGVESQYVVFEPNQIKSLFNVVGEPDYNEATNTLTTEYGYQVEGEGEGVKENYDDFSHIQDPVKRKESIDARASYLESKGATVQKTENGVKHFADPENIFFQTGDTEGSEMSDVTVEKWKEWFKANGVDYDVIEGGLTNEDGEPLDANEFVNVANRIVRIVSGKENVAIGEAGMHIVTRIIKQQNPKLFREMMNKVSQYELYNETAEKYRLLKEYQTPDGKPDILKIKEEVVGKLLNEYYIQSQESTTLEKPERIKQVQSWWTMIKNWLKDFFTGNPLDTAAKEREQKADDLFKGVVEDFDKGLFNVDELTDRETNEDFSDFKNRTIETISKIAERVPDNTAIVTHGTAISLLKTWKESGYSDGKISSYDYNNQLIDNGHIEEIEINGKKIYLVRHGESQANLENTESTPETPLTAKGMSDALKVAEELKEKGIETVISTNTERTNETAKIIRRELGSKSEDIFFQLSKEKEERKEKSESEGKKIADTIKTFGSRMKLNEADKKGKSFYTVVDSSTGEVERIKRVHDYIEDIYEEAYGKKDESKMDKMYAETGTRLHGYIEDVLNRLVDPKTNFIRSKADFDNAAKGTIAPGEEKIYNKLEKYVWNSLQMFPKSANGEGFRILYEQRAYKPGKGKKGKGAVGATLDFIAISPDGYAYLKDWKFMKDQAKNVMGKDINNVTQRAHRAQLNWYEDIVKSIAPVKGFKESNTIPFKLVFDEKDPSKLIDIITGDTDYSEIEDRTLLPITSGNVEVEGDPKLSALYKNLTLVLDKMYGENVPYEDRLLQQQEIQELSYAIRSLINQKNVSGVTVAAFNRVKSFIKELTELKTLIDNHTDGEKFDKETAGNIVAKVNDMKLSLETFKDLRDTLSEFTEGMDPSDKKMIDEQLDDIDTAITRATRLLYDPNTKMGLLEQAGIKIGDDIGIYNIMSPDREMTMDQQLWNTHISLPFKTGNAYSKIRSDIENKVAISTVELSNKLNEIGKGINDWMGGSWDDMKLINAICKKNAEGKWTPYLVNKISKEFYEKLDKAIDKKDIKWIRQNINVEAYKKTYESQLEKVKKRAQEKVFDIKSYEEDPKKRKGTLDEKKRQQYIQWFVDNYDIERDSAFTHRNNWLKGYATDANWSNEYKAIHAQKPLLDLYNFVVNLNERAHRSGMLGDYYIHFLPQMRKRTMDAALHFQGKEMKRSFISKFVVEEGEGRYRDPQTGEVVHKLRGKYIYDLGGEGRDYSDVDTDLMKSLTKYIKEVVAHEAKTREEGLIKALLAIEKNKKSLAVEKGKVVERQGKPVTKDSSVNYDWLEQEIITNFYDDKYGEDNAGMRVNVDGDEFYLSYKKALDSVANGFTLKTLGANPMPALANLFGGKVNAYINSGKHFAPEELMEAMYTVPKGKIFSTEEGNKFLSLINHFMPFTDDIASELGKNASKHQVLEFMSGEGLMFLMRKSDKIVQMGNAYVYFKNTMIENGKFVNIREYVKRKNKYYEMFEGDNASKYTKEQRMEMAEKIEKEIKELQNKRNLFNDENIKYSKDKYDIDWQVEKLDESELDLRSKIVQLTRDCLGSRTPDERAHINNYLLGTIGMTFRNWIPRLAQKRYGRFKYNSVYGTYEQGRMHSLMDSITSHAQYQNNKLLGTLAGSWDVLKYANFGSKEEAIIAAAQRQYQRRVAEARFQEQTTESMFEKTISEGEFVENYMRDVRAQVRELQFTIALMSAFFAALGYAKSLDKDDQTFAQKGATKWTMRMLDKFSDELGFFYSPMSAKAIIGSGNIIPAFSIFTDIGTMLSHLTQEGYYLATGDEESQDKNYVIKYPISYIPVVNQISAYSAIVSEDYAKFMGIKQKGYEWAGGRK